MFKKCCEFLLHNNTSEILFYSIDVALNNFSISLASTKRNVRINFFTMNKYQKLLPEFLNMLVEQSNQNKIYFTCEKQIARATNNIRLEYFLRGVLKTLCVCKNKNISFREYQPKRKVSFANTLGWSYEKIRSKKRFTQLLGSSDAFRQLTDGWTCAFCDIKDCSFTEFNRLEDQQKFDDFVDTLLILGDTE